MGILEAGSEGMEKKERNECDQELPTGFLKCCQVVCISVCLHKDVLLADLLWG